MHALCCSRIAALHLSGRRGSCFALNRCGTSYPLRVVVATTPRYLSSKPIPNPPSPNDSNTSFLSTKGQKPNEAWETWVKERSPGDTSPPVSFPWLFTSAPVVYQPFPYRLTYLPHQWLHWIPTSFYHALSRSLVMTYLAQATGREYLGDQFLYGVSLIASRLFRAISEKNEKDLESYLMKPLRERILKELDGIKASGHELQVYVPRVHDCVISDAWMWAGYSAAFENGLFASVKRPSNKGDGNTDTSHTRLHTNEYNSNILELATIFIGLNQRPTPDNAQELVKNAVKDGAKFRLDVEVDLELHWRVTHSLLDGNIASNIITGADIKSTSTNDAQHNKIHTDDDADKNEGMDRDAVRGLVAEGGRRRTLTISLDTPWFRPTTQMLELWGKENQPSDWQWKISDVDFLLREEELEMHK
ncbi:hypothetical protein BDF19DRAFT_443634 [Syncephalis fuscata]|nr:hypothetical protein BDF19DRAFT_443634 [Syncephalis fuscata]